MSADSSVSALLLADTHLRRQMPTNDRQKFAVRSVVKRWWTRTRDLYRSRKRKSQTEKLGPKVSHESQIMFEILTDCVRASLLTPPG